MCMYICSLVLVCTETRQDVKCFSSIALCLILVRQELSMNLKFTVLARLASHWTPGIHLIEPPICAHDQLFYLVTGSLNSGPHAYKASILTYWVSHFSSPATPVLWCIFIFFFKKIGSHVVHAGLKFTYPFVQVWARDVTSIPGNPVSKINYSDSTGVTACAYSSKYQGRWGGRITWAQNKTLKPYKTQK